MGSQTLSKNIKKKKLTFGDVKNLLCEQGALHDPSIEEALKQYADARNAFAHKLVIGSFDIDIDQFLTVGDALINVFGTYLSKLSDDVADELFPDTE